jgi:hypothetical protein
MKQTHYEENCNEVEWKVGKTNMDADIFANQSVL